MTCLQCAACRLPLSFHRGGPFILSPSPRVGPGGLLAAVRILVITCGQASALASVITQSSHPFKKVELWMAKCYVVPSPAQTLGIYFAVYFCGADIPCFRVFFDVVCMQLRTRGLRSELFVFDLPVTLSSVAGPWARESSWDLSALLCMAERVTPRSSMGCAGFS